MGYVDANLMPNESVRYRAAVHWYVYANSATFLLLGSVLLGLGRAMPTGSATAPILIGCTMVVLSPISFIRALIIRRSTEMAVTDRRVIAKTGFVRRNTTELNHSKVESFNIEQGIFGRVLNYGTVTIHGTGGGKTVVPNIDDPLEFRRQAMAAIER